MEAEQTMKYIPKQKSSPTTSFVLNPSTGIGPTIAEKCFVIFLVQNSSSACRLACLSPKKRGRETGGPVSANSFFRARFRIVYVKVVRRLLEDACKGTGWQALCSLMVWWVGVAVLGEECDSEVNAGADNVVVRKRFEGWSSRRGSDWWG
jgi:hypothetical protein